MDTYGCDILRPLCFNRILFTDKISHRLGCTSDYTRYFYSYSGEQNFNKTNGEAQATQDEAAKFEQKFNDASLETESIQSKEEALEYGKALARIAKKFKAKISTSPFDQICFREFCDNGFFDFIFTKFVRITLGVYN